MNGKIKKAYDFIVNACNADNVGYSQTYRDGRIRSNGLRYYDCSSLIYYALKHAGFPVGSVEIYTAIMDEWLLDLGFTRYSADVKWKAGDILLRSGHTEMVYKPNYTMGAHSSNYGFERQVSINDFESSGASWTWLYRYEKGDSSEDIPNDGFTHHIMNRFIKRV